MSNLDSLGKANGVIYENWQNEPITEKDLNHGSYYSDISPSTSNHSRLNYGMKISNCDIDPGIEPTPYIRKGRERMNALDSCVTVGEKDRETYINAPYITSRTLPHIADYNVMGDDYTSSIPLDEIVNDGSDVKYVTNRMDGAVKANTGNFLTTAVSNVEGFVSDVDSTKVLKIVIAIIIILALFIVVTQYGPSIVNVINVKVFGNDEKLKQPSPQPIQY